VTNEQTDTLIGLGSRIVGGLSSQPLTLALIVLQALTFAAVLYSSVHRQEAVTQQMTSMADIIKACVQRSQ